MVYFLKNKNKNMYVDEINIVNSEGIVINPATDEILRKLLIMLAPLSTQDTNQRIRITLDAITGGLTLAAISTVSNVTSLNQYAGVDARYTILDNARNMYGNSIRPYLSFT
jgi:hypothetical protein